MPDVSLQRPASQTLDCCMVVREGWVGLEAVRCDELAAQGRAAFVNLHRTVAGRRAPETFGRRGGQGRGGGVVWVMAVRYSDRYRREAGSWLISARRVSYAYRLRAEDYLTRFGEVIAPRHGKEEW